MNSFQKFMMVQSIKIIASVALVEVAGALIGIIVAEEPEKKEETKSKEHEEK